MQGLYGSDGTRTRDLRRDRPVLASGLSGDRRGFTAGAGRSDPAVAGTRGRGREFAATSCGMCAEMRSLSQLATTGTWARCGRCLQPSDLAARDETLRNTKQRGEAGDIPASQRSKRSQPARGIRRCLYSKRAGCGDHRKRALKMRCGRRSSCRCRQPYRSIATGTPSAFPCRGARRCHSRGCRLVLWGAGNPRSRS